MVRIESKVGIEAFGSGVDAIEVHVTQIKYVDVNVHGWK